MNKYYCPHCNYYFYSEESLNNHIAHDHTVSHQGQEILRKKKPGILSKLFLPEGTHYCPGCNLTFFSLESLQKHVISEHTKS